MIEYGGKSLGSRALAHYCRKILSDSLKSEKPLEVNVLLAGVDDLSKTSVLFRIDEYGSIHEVSHGAHGRDVAFVLASLDRSDELRPHRDLDANQGLQLLTSIWAAVRKRSTNNSVKCKWKFINSDTKCVMEGTV